MEGRGEGKQTLHDGKHKKPERRKGGGIPEKKDREVVLPEKLKSHPALKVAKKLGRKESLVTKLRFKSNSPQPLGGNK